MIQALSFSVVLTNGKYFQAEVEILLQNLPIFYCSNSKSLREARRVLWHSFAQCCLEKKSLVSGFYFPVGGSLLRLFMHATPGSVYDTGKVWWPLFPSLPSCSCSPAQPDSQAEARIHPQASGQGVQQQLAHRSKAILSCPCPPGLHPSSALGLIAQTSPGWHQSPALPLHSSPVHLLFPQDPESSSGGPRDGRC